MAIQLRQRSMQKRISKNAVAAGPVPGWQPRRRKITPQIRVPRSRKSRRPTGSLVSERITGYSSLAGLGKSSQPPADTEHVAIGMAKVHLADVPRHISGRKCDLQ